MLLTFGLVIGSCQPQGLFNAYCQPQGLFKAYYHPAGAYSLVDVVWPWFLSVSIGAINEAEALGTDQDFMPFLVGYKRAGWAGSQASLWADPFDRGAIFPV